MIFPLHCQHLYYYFGLSWHLQLHSPTMANTQQHYILFIRFYTIAPFLLSLLLMNSTLIYLFFENSTFMLHRNLLIYS